MRNAATSSDACKCGGTSRNEETDRVAYQPPLFVDAPHGVRAAPAVLLGARASERLGPSNDRFPAERLANLTVAILAGALEDALSPVFPLGDAIEASSAASMPSGSSRKFAVTNLC